MTGFSHLLGTTRFRAVRALLLALSLGLLPRPVHGADALDRIKQRGFLTCGVSPGVAGFSEVDAQGHYSGFDVDICRAVAAAILGKPDAFVFKQAASVQAFVKSTDIDIISRLLTWSLERESTFGVRFGPITFYDGQGFLVDRRHAIGGVKQLAGATVCVEPGAASEFRLGAYFRAQKLALKKVVIESTKNLGDAFDSGRCTAFTADVSELASLRKALGRQRTLDILPEQISKEPLAQLVRADDLALWRVLQWTVFALVWAEELGLSSDNLDRMLGSEDPDVRRLLGVLPGSGKALGLDEQWAYRAIRAVGNYGQIFERNLGSRSPIGLERGLNALWTAGGLMYAPPLH